jgi:O-antigen ligase
VIMMIGLALTLLLLVVSKGWRRWVVWLILLGIAATVARSGSRGAFLGFITAAGGALFLVNSVSASRRMSLLVAVLIALVLGAPPGYWQQMGTLLQPKEDYNYSSLDGRRALILRGIHYMERFPIFGLGIDNFGRAECTISPKLESLRINGPMRCTPPHNSYVQAASEMGVPGIIVWVSLVFGGIIGPLRLRKRLPRSWMQGTESQRFIYSATSFFAVAMVGFAVTSFFVSFAWVDSLYLQSALLAGLYVAARVEMHGGTGGRTVPVDPASRSVGWRVLRSARRANALPAT